MKESDQTRLESGCRREDEGIRLDLARSGRVQNQNEGKRMKESDQTMVDQNQDEGERMKESDQTRIRMKERETDAQRGQVTGKDLLEESIVIVWWFDLT